MPWKKETLMSQKLNFIQSVAEGSKSFSQLCFDYNISRKTGYAILKRYQQEGVDGLQLRSKSPHHQPLKTSTEIVKAIIDARIKYSWGPKKIRAALLNKNIQSVPSVSTIANILKREGYITIEESLKRKKLIRFEREFSNDLWQIDFKGKFQMAIKSPCYPLTILDDYSRFSLDIRACANEQYNTVFQHLTRIFREFGLPKQINFDNGNPWGNSRQYQHTTLTVWLMRLGIKVSHSRPYHPQTNGKIERFHRSLKEEVLSKVEINNLAHAQHLFDDWRKIYNNERPHEGIGMLVPAKRYQLSTISMPNQLPPIEYDQKAYVLKVRGNGYITYQGKNYRVGEAFKELHVRVENLEERKQIKIYLGAFKIYTYPTI